MNGIIAGTTIPQISLWNSIPLRLGASKLNARKATAIIERIFTNTRDAVRDYYTRKATAPPERTFTNTRDAIGDHYSRKTTAITECRNSNARYLIGTYIRRNINLSISTASNAYYCASTIIVRRICKPRTNLSRHNPYKHDLQSCED